MQRFADLCVAFLSDESGQAATEYVLVISVVVIGVTSAGYSFVPLLRTGVHSLGEDVSEILRTHEIKGVTNGPGETQNDNTFRGQADEMLNHSAPDYNSESQRWRMEFRDRDPNEINLRDIEKFEMKMETPRTHYFDSSGIS